MAIVEHFLKFRTEQARQALAQAGDQAEATADRLQVLGRRADDTSDTASRMAQAFGVLSPEIGGSITVIADLADGMRGVTEIGGALGLGLGSLAAGAGILAAGVGVLGAAFVSTTTEMELQRAEAETYKQVNDAAADSVYALRDAEIDLAVALGQVAEVEGAVLKIRLAARKSVLDYGAGLRDQRRDLQDQITSSETWVGVLGSVQEGLDSLNGYAGPTGIAVRALTEGFTGLVNETLGTDLEPGLLGVADAVFGLSDSADSAQRQIDALNDSVEEEAKRQKELADALEELEKQRDRTTRATDRQTEATEKLAQVQGVFSANELLQFDRAIEQALKELEGVEAQLRLQIDMEDLTRQMSGVADAFAMAVAKELAGQISLLGVSNVSDLARGVGGPAGQVMGATFDVLSGFADRDNSTLDQLTASIVDVFEGFKNIGAEAVEFVFDGLIKQGIPALIEGVIGAIPTLVAEIASTLASPEFWIDVAKAFVDALLDALNPFNDLFGGGTGGGAAQATATAYSQTQFGLMTPGGSTRTSSGSSSQSSRVAATSEGLTFTVRPADLERIQYAQDLRKIEVNGG